ncbi:MAG: hydrogen gas-evolving membrane-bound hydrogenase subunit E [Oscillibacter sp.]|uniref:hydrogen gas-evolving membrane-bound hydrogenase subunit E n=1 Tax=Oscillibacter sp. TaxID=1945593 RepID=UPI0028A0DFB9|nr:hydrogen gas-evolving membrane-bound hydrogenase subunit E [Oscillibacter sp.]MEA4994353.1 hydrogen gas-evolving membrane-bound hydrogenase subunit E [Oscillibacter sp.]
MSERSGWKRFADWVNGEAEAGDPTTQYVMNRRPARPQETQELHEARERLRLKKFLGLYPLAAGLLCVILIFILLSTVIYIPPFGQPGNPTNNEVSRHYLENTVEETGASNAVTGMILCYRGFDTLGESCVLFLAVSSVMILLQRDRNNTGERAQLRMKREDAAERAHEDNILQKSAKLLTPFVFLFALYVLMNGESSPGGGFSGGAILSGGLILYSVAFGPERLSRLLTRSLYSGVRVVGLMAYALTYGVYIFAGANGLSIDMEWMMTVIELAVGLVVACAIYGFYAMFQRGKI